jgi:hypothetical protein
MVESPLTVGTKRYPVPAMPDPSRPPEKTESVTPPLVVEAGEGVIIFNPGPGPMVVRAQATESIEKPPAR